MVAALLLVDVAAAHAHGNIKYGMRGAPLFLTVCVSPRQPPRKTQNQTTAAIPASAWFLLFIATHSALVVVVVV